MSSVIATPITLESVKSQFAEWRATRIKGQRIPKALWESVKHLSKHYEHRCLALELKLSLHQLKAKLGVLPQPAPSFASSPVFIEFPLSPLSSPGPLCEEQKMLPAYGGTLELARPDGAVLKATGLNPRDVYALIQKFVTK